MAAYAQAVMTLTAHTVVDVALWDMFTLFTADQGS